MDHREIFDIQIMCEVLDVSKRGYYDWVKRDHISKAERLNHLEQAIRQAFDTSRKVYGSPKIYHELKKSGYKVSKDTVARIMHKMNIKAKTKRRFKIVTTDSKHTFPVAENLVAQNFEVSVPGEILLGDITYIPTGEGWLYLAGVLDLCTRKIVGWSMSGVIDRQLTIAALNMALRNQKLASETIFHSDRGSQYACHDYQGLLVEYGITASMSGVGCCYDNAPMESFFHTLKAEFVHHQFFATRDEAKRQIFEWIEVFYNRQRLHSSLGYKTPFAFAEEKMLEAA